jgi:23S rRNA pseudouridine2604 synthase
MRVDKYISHCTDYSLRDALRLIQEGRVKLNGREVNSNRLVKLNDSVLIDNKKVVFTQPDAVYIAYNKPRGVECTSDRNISNNIMQMIQIPGVKLINIGRLDKDSEGLILMTNNGDIVNRIIHSDFKHEKEYFVKIDKPLKDKKVIEILEAGVDLWDYVTQPCKIEVLNEACSDFKILLREGKNRQIRRMFEKFKYTVVELKRLRVINIQLGDLETGAYRHLARGEVKKLSEHLHYKIPSKLSLKF